MVMGKVCSNFEDSNSLDRMVRNEYLDAQLLLHSEIGTEFVEEKKLLIVLENQASCISITRKSINLDVL